MTNKQIFTKTVGWRIIATTITFGTTWAVTESFAIGTAVGAIDGLIKFVGYFFYEKLWDKKNEDT